MDDFETLIKQRHSVRKYLSKPIEKNKIDELNSYIDNYNKEANLNIQLVLDNKDVFDKFILHYGRIENAKSYIALIGNKNDKFVDEKVGYYGEKLVLLAQKLGLNTCWVAGTLNKKYVKATINSNEELICVIAIGYGENQGNLHNSNEFALLAPTALNEQKFKFELLKGNKVKLISPSGRLKKIDLGIVKYHFELGAGIQNFKWAD